MEWLVILGLLLVGKKHKSSVVGIGSTEKLILLKNYTDKIKFSSQYFQWFINPISETANQYLFNFFYDTFKKKYVIIIKWTFGGAQQSYYNGKENIDYYRFNTEIEAKNFAKKYVSNLYKKNEKKQIAIE